MLSSLPPVGRAGRHGAVRIAINITGPIVVAAGPWWSYRIPRVSPASDELAGTTTVINETTVCQASLSLNAPLVSLLLLELPLMHLVPQLVCFLHLRDGALDPKRRDTDGSGVLEDGLVFELFGLFLTYLAFRECLFPHIALLHTLVDTMGRVDGRHSGQTCGDELLTS